MFRVYLHALELEGHRHSTRAASCNRGVGKADGTGLYTSAGACTFVVLVEGQR